jgi:hypothetical protein
VTQEVGLAWLAVAALLRQQADDPNLDQNLRQACLRRSISTAYYAVFHLITGDSVALVCVDACGSSVAHRLRRALNHIDVKKVLASLIGSVEYGQKTSSPSPIAMPLQCLQSLAETFISLQKARESADYAFDQPVEAVKADQVLANAEAVISEWQLLSLDLKQQFAQLLLLRVMPNQR